MFGASVLFLRALAYVVTAVLIVLSRDSFAGVVNDAGGHIGDDEVLFLAIVVSGGAIVLALLELGLGAAVPAGRNCARITAMSLSVVGTTSAFLGTVQGSEVIGLTSLPTVGSAILVLLALSSHRAREYATRHRTREVE